MRLLITGGCGFIGTNFIRYQIANHPQTTVLNLDKLTYAGNLLNLADIEKEHGGTRYFFEKADIADATAVQSILKKFSPDAIINFAAESHVDRSISDPAPFVTTNVLGTQVLMQAARDAGIPRFVHISTDEVYGSLKADEPAFTEQNPLLPNSPYSASKAGADLMVRAFVETFGFPAIITRCSNNYGPYQFPEKLIPLMISKAWEEGNLPVYGDGLNIRDWIHVEDHCHGIDLALRTGKEGAIYNFGGNAERSNIDVVKAILKLTGKPESLITYVKDRPGHDKRYAMDYSLAQRELGYTPAHSFEQGLADTLKWYENNKEWLDNVKSGAYMEFMSRWYGER
ncbi:dTDP-glucose 4,6-dehydratase [Oleidesulfovibrio sp.]|uniref:dTDP-glucose 4,6-dehydratase n=1 Tax=Oleidesulfovibrio sp. TaxID=2909707 RepID=UPI003A87BAEB